MRRVTLWLVATITAVVLLFSYRTSLAGPAPATAAAAAAPGIVPDSPAPSGSVPSGTTRTRTLTVNGTVADTRWGPVQVQVKIINNKIIMRPGTVNSDSAAYLCCFWN